MSTSARTQKINTQHTDKPLSQQDDHCWRGKVLPTFLIVPVCISCCLWDLTWVKLCSEFWHKGWRQPGPAGGWVGLYLGTQYTLHGLLLYSSVITRGEFNLTPITGLGHQREQELKLVQKWGWEDATQPGQLRPQNEFPRSKKPGSWKSRCRKINFMTSWRIIKHKAWHTRTRIIWYFMSKIKRDYIQCHKTIYSSVPVSCFYLFTFDLMTFAELIIYSFIFIASSQLYNKTWIHHDNLTEVKLNIFFRGTIEYLFSPAVRTECTLHFPALWPGLSHFPYLLRVRWRKRYLLPPGVFCFD